jgi:Na+/H+ antiporter NhaD/arsenite permease-like protein
MDWEYAVGLIVFVVTYALIALRNPKVKAWMAAIIGGCLMILLGVVAFDDALDYIHWSVLFLLVGMMMLASALGACGFFDLVTDWMMRRFPDRRKFLAAVMVITACLSAILLNDAVCLIFAPIVLRCCQKMKVNPVPYMIGVFVSANIGCMATTVGAPHNVVVASIAGIDFIDYAVIGIPIAAVCLFAAVHIVLRLVRNDLKGNDLCLAGHDFGEETVDRPRMYVLLAILVITAVLFALSDFIGVELGTIAICSGAAALLVTIPRGKSEVKQVIAGVDWSILIYFLGMFFLIAGVDSCGIVDGLADLFGMDDPSVGSLAAFTVILSNLVSNVPSVMLEGNMFEANATAILWATLAVSSSLAGNLTMIGAASNTIVQDRAEMHGVRIDFVQYLKIGVPVTLATTVIAVVMLYGFDLII